MADLIDLFKRNKEGLPKELNDEVTRELLKYGRNLEEWKQLENLDEEYKQAKLYMAETKEKLDSVEREMKKIEKDNEEKSRRAHECHIQAKTLYDKREFNAAIDKWNEALGFDPNHQGAVYGIGEAKNRIKEVFEEEQLARDERERKLQKAEEHYLQGKKYFAEGSYEVAILEWREAMLLGGKDPRYSDACEMAEQKIEEQLDESNRRRLEEEEKKRNIQDIWLEGRKYLRNAEYDQAIETLDKILAIAPQNKMVVDEIRRAEQLKREREKKNIELENKKVEDLRRIREYQVKAMHYEKEGEYESAIEMLSQILEIDPSLVRVLDDIKELQNKIVLEEETRREEERLAEEKMKKIEEESAKKERDKKEKLLLHYSRGTKFYLLGNYEKAVEELEQVILIDPSYEKVQKYLDDAGKKVIELREERITRQREEAKTAEIIAEEKKRAEEKIEIEVRDYFKRGLKFYDNEDYEQAIEEWENALTLNRNDNGIKTEIDKAREKLEEKKKFEAKRMQEEARRKEEEFRKENLAKLYSEQAEIYFREAEYERAISEWKKVLELDFSSNDIRGNILRAEKAIKEIEWKKLEKEKREREKKKEIQEICFRAEEFFSEAEYERAVELWKKVLDLDPLNKQAQEGIIKSKAISKEIEMREKAKEFAQQLIKQEEEKIKKMREIYEEGQRLYKEGEFGKAIKEWEKAMGKLR